ncbi:MAG: hypothetical protein ACRDT5_25285, partial [Mycobacterium sp.]
MPVIPPNNWGRARFLFNVGAASFGIGLEMHTAGAGDITSVEAMAADLATPFVTDVLALLHNDVTLTEIVCETS